MTDLLKEFKLDDVNIKSNIKQCKGLFWRATVNSYVSSHNSIEVRKSLRLLKRMSCTGCVQCDWIWECFREDIGEFPDYIGDVENGEIYTYSVNTSQGYYDLYPEIDNIEFVKVKKENNALQRN